MTPPHGVASTQGLCLFSRRDRHSEDPVGRAGSAIHLGGDILLFKLRGSLAVLTVLGGLTVGLDSATESGLVTVMPKNYN
jgi:hypothetical protein